MDRRGLTRMGIISLAIVSLAIFIFMISQSLSFSGIPSKSYSLGDSIKFDFKGQDYKLKMVTPSASYLREGKNDVLSFKLNENGAYSFFVTLENKTSKYDIYVGTQRFVSNSTVPTEQNNAVQDANISLETNSSDTPIGVSSDDFFIANQPARWRINFSELNTTLVKIPKNSFNITINGKPQLNKAHGLSTLSDSIEMILDGNFTDAGAEYYTEGPKSSEKVLSSNKKEVRVYSNDSILYNNVMVYSNLSIKVSEMNNIKVYWKEQNKYVDFDISREVSGKIQSVNWLVPNSSNQTFDIIIITKAEQLDANRNFVADIYDSVKAKDGIWSPTISDGQYVRATFAHPLSNGNDITIYTKKISGNPKVEVYEVDKNQTLLTFYPIKDNQYDKLIFSSLSDSQDTFDLHITGGSVQFDHIVDPMANYIDGGATGSIGTTAGTATTLASVSSTIPGTNLILGAVQVLSTDNGAENIVAGALNLYGNSGVLATNQYNIGVSTANLNNNYFILGVDQDAPAGTIYNVTAFSSATAVNTEAKIVVLSGIKNWGFNDSVSTAFSTTETTLATVPTSFSTGDNIIVAAVQITNGGTAQDIPPSGIKIKNGNTLLTSSQYSMSLGTTAPTNIQDIVVIAKDTGAAANSLYNITIVGAQSATAEAKVMVFRVYNSSFVDGGSVNLPASAINVAGLTTSFAAGSDVVVIAAGQINDTDTGVETLAATTGYQLRENNANKSSNQLIMSAFAASGSAGDGIRHTLLWRNSSSSANPFYNLSATASATGLRGEAKILALQIAAPDSTVPEINITYPLNKTYNLNVSQLNYTYNDVNPNSCWYSTDNGVTNSSGVEPGNNFTNLASSEGSNIWIVYCNDTVGNQNQTNVTFFKDTLNPDILFGTGTDSNNTAISRGNIIVNVTANDTNLANITIYLYNTTGLVKNVTTLTSPNYFNFTNLQDGQYWFNASSYDVVSNVNYTETYNLSINRAVPTIQFGIGTDSNNSNLSRSNIVINVTANDTDLANITIYLYNGSRNMIRNTTAGISPNYVNYTLLPDGLYYFNASANDSLGNINYVGTYAVTIDTASPNPLIVYPANNSYAINVSGLNYTCNEPGFVWYSINYGITNSSINSCGTNFTNIQSVEGSNTWILYANDTAGNLNSTNVTFFKDSINPDILFGTGTEVNNSYIPRANIVINVTANDTNLANITIYLYNTTGLVKNVTTLTSPSYFNFTNLQDGQYWFNSTAFDIVSNSNKTSTYNITVDTTFPKIVFGARTEFNYSNFTRNWVYVNVSVNETNEANITFDFYDISGNSINETTYVDKTRTINWTGLSDGLYYYNITISDLANNLNQTSTYGITLDNTAPVITIVSPEPREYARNTSIDLNYTLLDSLSLISSCWWNIDNKTNSTITCGQNTSFNVSVGGHTIYFYSNDTLNNIGEDEVIFAASTSGVAIQKVVPIDGAYLNYSQNINFSYIPKSPNNISACYLYGDWTGTFEINQTHLAPVNWSVDSFYVNISNNGPYTWNVWCNDSTNDGGFGLFNSTFTLDTILPQIDYGSRTLPSIYNVSLNWIYVNTSVTELNEANITFYLYDSSSALVSKQTFSDGTRSINWTSLDDGVYYYNVSIYDLSINYNSTLTRKITLDTTYPILNISSPQGTNYTSNNISFNFNVSDINLISCWYTINNDATNLTLANCQNTTFISTQGQTNLTLYANDTAGNENNTNITFFVDSLNPQIKYDVRTDLNNSNLTRSNIVVNVTAADANLANITIYLYNSSDLVENVTTSSSPNYFNFTNLPDGQYWFNGSAYDILSNVNYTATYNVMLDTSVPIPTIFYPLNITYSSNVSQLNYTCNEQGFVWYSIDDGVTNSTINACGTNFTNVLSVEGSNTWILYANDTVGNQNQTNVTFFKDSINPSINFSSGTAQTGSELEQGWIYENLTALDTNFANVTFDLYNSTNGATFVNETTFYSPVDYFDINFTNLSSANITYYYNATSYDILGNFNKTETRTIKLIDVSPPVLSISSPQNVTYDYNQSLTLSYTVNDANLNSCWWNLDNQANSSVTCGQDVNFDTSEGSHKLFLYANDSLNQVSYQNVTFVANNSLTSTPDYIVQRGSIALSSLNNATLSTKTDKTKSFIILNTRSASSTPNILQVTANYTNSTMISFYNYAGTANVEWESVSGSKLNVQRGDNSYVAAATTINITISPVNLSSSFVIIQNRLNTATAGQYIRGMWTGVLLNSTRLQLQRATTATAGMANWQVVDWAGANVQNGTLLLTTVSSNVNLSNSVQTDRTFSIFSTRAVTSTNANSLFGNSRFLNSTTLQLSRGGGAAGTLTFAWFTVSHDDIRVNNGSFLMGAFASRNTTIPELVNWSKSFRVTSQNTTGAVTTYANAHVTTIITNITNMEFDKGATAQTNVINWQTIEFIERNSPDVDLIYPLNNTNFSSFVVSSFNYTVNDSSDLVNCSLVANWTGNFGINQTESNPVKGTPSNFSAVDIGTDGHYVWNVQCYDVYGNLGMNSSNYSLAAFLSPSLPTFKNMTQTINDGKGNITLSWNAASHADYYNVYYSNNLSSFILLNITSQPNYTDTSFAGNTRRFYKISTWNPTAENVSSEIFSAQVYNLAQTTNTRNLIGFNTNASYLTSANDSLYEIRNITSINMWNSTIQKSVTCNTFSCPSFPSCTDTNCNFDLSQGLAYEVNLNSSAPSNVNWSLVGVVYPPINITLTKNLTSTGKNWVSLPSNTSLINAQTILGNVSSADSVTKWDSINQKSLGLIPSPFPIGPKFIGNNFNISLESGYEISVNQTIGWQQI